MDLDLLLQLLEGHPKLLALVAGAGFISHLLAFLVDSRKTFHRVAMALRVLADVLDRAPVVAADVQAGDVRRAVQDAQGDVPAVAP
jgi:hypothetical protein